MSVSRNRIKCILSVALTCVTLLLGCGEKEVTGETGKSILSDGSLEATIVRDFDESLYSVSELEAMMNSEVSEYNASHGAGSVNVVSVGCENNKVTAVMNYESDEAYSEFNGRFFTHESYDEAVADGTIKVSMRDAANLEQVDAADISGGDKMDVIVTDEVGYLTFPGKVRYISDGVLVITGKQVLVSDEMDGLAYIVYSRK